MYEITMYTGVNTESLITNDRSTHGIVILEASHIVLPIIYLYTLFHTYCEL
jgi:hypothetical protein